MALTGLVRVLPTFRSLNLPLRPFAVFTCCAPTLPLLSTALLHTQPTYVQDMLSLCQSRFPNLHPDLKPCLPILPRRLLWC